MKYNTFRELMNRLFDLLIALMAGLILAPVFLVLIVIVYCYMGRPVFFTQNRICKDNRVFRIIKFRTMLAQTKKRQTDAQRMTPFGYFLRSTSLDELPELWNVLKGEMSLVGPRPLLVQYVPLYTPEQARRHEVRPGITGWAQINGRNAISWEAKFKLDVWYVDNQSMFLDLKILTLTVWKIITRQGIEARGEATMPVFTGTPKKTLTFK